MILGLTGCPGSGKSVLAGIMAAHGWDLVDADRLGRVVIEENRSIPRELARIFGADILHSDGTMDRRLLARRAFATVETTRLLNEVVHPVLVRKVIETVESRRSAARHAVVDCALIFEWNIQDRFDRIVCVRAEESIRRKRLSSRDGRSMEETERLFKAQLSEDEKALRSHIAIANNGPLEDLAAFGLLLADLPAYQERAKEWMGRAPGNENG